MRLLILLLFISLATRPALAQPEENLFQGYNDLRNPYSDFHDARQLAEDTDRLVLVVLGGNWCGWCKILDTYLNSHSLIRDYLTTRFVLVKVYYHPWQKNTSFLNRIIETGTTITTPFFVIADHSGKVIGYQETSSLELFNGYSDLAFIDFIDRWSHPENMDFDIKPPVSLYPHVQPIQ